MLFSIVIVNFNTGKYLEQAIQSVLRQTCQDYELIIVDGGSKDESVDIIKKYEDKLVWWVSEPDKGQSDAFNKGFSHAKGEFYLWLNADDLLFHTSLEKAKEAILRHPDYKWFFGNSLYINKDGVIVHNSRGCNMPLSIVKHAHILPCGPSTFFHKDLFKKFGPFDVDLHYTMDGDLWRRFVNGGAKYRMINSFCWVFRLHEESKTSDVFLGGLNEKVVKENKHQDEKNGVKLLPFHLAYEKIKRIIFCYPIIAFNKIRFKNKNISDLMPIR